MRRKIIFRLQQDADGYPPVGFESIWAIPRDGGLYQIDNIPFFATVGVEDVVAVREVDGELQYEKTVHRSGNSLIRVLYYKRLGVDPERLEQELQRLGCSTERDQVHGLIAVNVPSTTDLKAVQAYLVKEEATGRIGYEEPLLRQ